LELDDGEAVLLVLGTVAFGVALGAVLPLAALLAIVGVVVFGVVVVFVVFVEDATGFADADLILDLGLTVLIVWPGWII
tara:strand:- start:94 stop:330 length:237 start_codon:yes stop_codon:yes gene_type:complete